jgi:GNAT superfamily N-acetyltransferase
MVRARDAARQSSGPSVADGGIPLASATAGDHLAVHHLLLSVFLGPSNHEFQTQLDEPTYEPRDRLLVKHGQRVVSHLRLIRREMFFGSMLLPVTSVADVATSPEFCGRGYATALLASAERRMVEEGSVLGILRTDRIDFYRNRGWTVCGRHSYSVAGPHDILSHLKKSAPPQRRVSVRRKRPRRLHIRYWRRVEQDALMRLYQESVSRTYGSYLRTEAHWQWIANRRAYDHIYVAIEGSPRLELDETLSRIVGYAVVKSGRIVELTASSGRFDVLSELLVRICSDAIELDQRQLRLDAAPDHPLHPVMLAAGGRNVCCSVDGGYAHMVRLLDPQRFVSSLHQEFLQRARANRLRLPAEVGICADGEKVVLRVTPEQSELAESNLGRSYLTCSQSQLVQGLLGHLDIKRAVANGTMDASTRLAVEVSHALLPKLPLWCPTFDDLPA